MPARPHDPQLKLLRNMYSELRAIRLNLQSLVQMEVPLTTLNHDTDERLQAIIARLDDLGNRRPRQLFEFAPTDFPQTL